MVKDIATGLLCNAQKKTAKEPATGAILLPFSFAMDKPTLTAGGERARAASFAIIRWMKTACFSLWGDALATPTGSARQVLEPEKDQNNRLVERKRGRTCVLGRVQKDAKALGDACDDESRTA